MLSREHHERPFIGKNNVLITTWMVILTQKRVKLENNQVLGGYLFTAADDFQGSILQAPVTVFIPGVSEYLKYNGSSVLSHYWNYLSRFPEDLWYFDILCLNRLISSLKASITFWKEYSDLLSLFSNCNRMHPTCNVLHYLRKIHAKCFSTYLVNQEMQIFTFW